MKRSSNIRLILISGLSASALTGCSPQPSIRTENVYTNNFYVPGTGYYHAPFRNWYALPYNHFDAQKQLYFHGGQWSPQPFASLTNISAPLPEAVQVAQNTRSDIARSGFGSYAGHHGNSGFHS